MKPIAIRLKNPLNLRPLPRGQMWQDQIGVEETASGPFCRWATWPPGWRAAFVLLQNYKKLHGLDTLEGILNRWAPPSDRNHTPAYIARVERLSGFRRSDPLDFFDWETAERVGEAMHRVEAGLSDDAPLAYTRGAMLKGMELAGIRLPDELQPDVETAPPPQPMGGGEKTGVGLSAAGAVAAAAMELAPQVDAASDAFPWLKIVAVSLFAIGVGLTLWSRLRA